MRFGSAVRVSGRVAFAAVAVAAVAVAVALEDLIKGDRDWDWDNRKDAAFERRIYFERGEIRLSLVNRCTVCVMCDIQKVFGSRCVLYVIRM